MKIGLRVPPSRSLGEMAAMAVEVEQAGFDIIWVPDSQLIWGDVWATLGAMAVATSRICLGSNVTNSVTRHASVTAGAAATIFDAAPGRFILGIGVGDSSVRIMGKRPSRIVELREYVEETRILLSGGTLTAPGHKEYRLIEKPTGPIPIYISATGPKMLELGGEMGDGVIFVGGLTADDLAYARQHVDAGARHTGRSPSEVGLSVGCFCFMGDDLEYGRLQMRPYAAVFALRHPEMLGGHGINPPDIERNLGFYPDLGHARDWDAAIEQTSWVPDEVLQEFCDRYCLIGDGPEILSKVLALRDRGVDDLYVRGVYSYRLPRDLTSGFADHVIPNL